jgi:hypothetical protein
MQPSDTNKCIEYQMCGLISLYYIFLWYKIHVNVHCTLKERRPVLALVAPPLPLFLKPYDRWYQAVFIFK